MNIKMILLLLVFSLCAYSFGKSQGLSNQTANYGSQGYPQNCRALITDNIDEYKSGQYTAEEVIESIERNCGFDGYLWKDK